MDFYRAPTAARASALVSPVAARAADALPDAPPAKSLPALPASPAPRGFPISVLCV
jgi:hypothetical protein